MPECLMETVKQKDESLKQSRHRSAQLPLDSAGPGGKDHREHAYASPLICPWLRLITRSSQLTCPHCLHQGRPGCISAAAWGSTGVSHHDSRSIHTDCKEDKPVQLRLPTRWHSFLALFYFPSTKPALQYVPLESRRPAPYWHNRAPDTYGASFQAAGPASSGPAKG